MAEVDARTSFLGLICKGLNQFAPLDDEIGIVQGDGRGAAIGEEFEAANFIEDGGFSDPAENSAYTIGDDKRALGRLEGFDSLKNAD